MNSSHLPTFFTIDLAEAFGVPRARFTEHWVHRAKPARLMSARTKPKLVFANDKHREKFTEAAALCAPAWLTTTARSLAAAAATRAANLPHPSFAAHGDPDRLDTLRDAFTTEQHHDIHRSWQCLEHIVKQATREACPVPKKSRMKVRDWSVAYCKQTHTLGVLHQILHAYKANKSPAAARDCAARLHQYAERAGVTALKTTPLPSTTQPLAWRSWSSAVEAEILTCKRSQHARYRTQLRTEITGHAKRIEFMRNNGRIKQAVRFALRRGGGFSPPITEVTVEPTVQSGLVFHKGGTKWKIAHVDQPTNSDDDHYAHYYNAETHPSRAPPPSEWQSALASSIAEWAPDVLCNTQEDVTLEIDKHMFKHFSRNKNSWVNSHPTSRMHPIANGTTGARKAREHLHRGTKKMYNALRDPDEYDEFSPFALKSADPCIHRVFDAFRFKQAVVKPTAQTVDIVDHPEYTTMEREMAAPITLAQMDAALRTRPKGKAPGGSGIRVEHIALLPDDLRQAFVDLCNAFVCAGAAPDEWYTAYVSLIPKEAGATSLSRMRPISLLEIPRKLIFTVKNRQLVNFWYRTGIISEEQYAFIAGKSTAEPAMIKKLMAEHAKHHKRNLAMLDIDLSKAYDTVEQWMVETALRRMGTPYSYINMLTHLHNRHTIRTNTGYGPTDGIHPQRGACPQGAIESCAIFLAVMDMGMETTRLANQAPYAIGTADVAQLMYCDDATYAVHGTAADLKNVAHQLAAFNCIANLDVNFKKSFVCVLEWNEDGSALDGVQNPLQFPVFTPARTTPLGPVEPWAIDTVWDDKRACIKCIAPTDQFRHLGNYQTTLGDSEQAITTLKGEVASSAAALNRHTLTAEHVKYCANSVVRPKVMYQLKFSNASAADIDAVHASLKAVVVNKAGCKRTIANKLVWSTCGGLNYSRWSDTVNLERLRIVLHGLQQRGTMIRAVLLDAISRLQSMSATTKPVLETKFSAHHSQHLEQLFKPEPTWMFRLWEWMTEHNITLHDPGCSSIADSGTVGTPISDLLQGSDTDQRKRATAIFSNARVNTVGDLLMSDGRTLTAQVRKSSDMMDTITPLLQIQGERSVTPHHRTTKPPVPCAVGDAVAWRDQRDFIRHGLIVTATSTTIKLSELTPGTPPKPPTTHRQSARVRHTNEGAYLTLHRHARATVTIDNTDVVRLDTTPTADGKLEVWSDPEWYAKIARDLAEDATQRVHQVYLSTGPCHNPAEDTDSDEDVQQNHRPQQGRKRIPPGSSDSSDSNSDTEPSPCRKGSPPPPSQYKLTAQQRLLIGEHIGRNALSAATRAQAKRIMPQPAAAADILNKRITDNRAITVYTDASFYRDEERGSYGWVAGAQVRQTFIPLAYGGGRENGADNVARKMSSTRLEKMALLSAATFLHGKGCKQATFHADNKSANKWFNDRANLAHPLYEWHKRPHHDLDGCLQQLMSHGLSPEMDVMWIRGHVENRKKKHSAWSVNECGNFLADAIAEAAYADHPTPIHPKLLDRNDRTKIYSNGNEITDHVTQAIEAIIGEKYMHEYMSTQPDVWGTKTHELDIRRLTYPKAFSTLRARAFHMKFIFGMLATNTEAAKTTQTGQEPTPPSADAGPVATGTTFHESATTWQVLETAPPPDDESAEHVVYYYDADAQTEDRATRDECLYASPTEVHRKVQASARAECKLPGCGDKCRQTNWHVFASCTSPAVMDARTKWASMTAKCFLRAMTGGQHDGAQTDTPDNAATPKLDMDIGNALMNIASLEHGKITDNWAPGTYHPTFTAIPMDMSEHTSRALGSVESVGAAAWWHGVWPKNLKKLLRLGGLPERQAQALITSLDRAHKKGWTGLHSAYREACGNTHTARQTARKAKQAAADAETNANITQIYADIAQAKPPPLNLSMPLDQRLAQSTRRKETWLATTRRNIAQIATSATRDHERAKRHALNQAEHDDFYAKGLRRAALRKSVEAPPSPRGAGKAQQAKAAAAKLKKNSVDRLFRRGAHAAQAPAAPATPLGQNNPATHAAQAPAAPATSLGQTNPTIHATQAPAAPATSPSMPGACGARHPIASFFSPGCIGGPACKRARKTPPPPAPPSPPQRTRPSPEDHPTTPSQAHNLHPKSRQREPEPTAKHTPNKRQRQQQQQHDASTANEATHDQPEQTQEPAHEPADTTDAPDSNGEPLQPGQRGNRTGVG
jgi:ribonuclease HI